MSWYSTTASSTTTGTSASVTWPHYVYNSTAATSNFIPIIELESIDINGTLVTKKSNSIKIDFKDGSKLFVDEQGNYRIDDKNAKVTYRANRNREFNQYVNASDLLEEFIRFLGKNYGIRQGQIMDVPIQVFIEWLIVQAAIKDGDEYGDDQKLLEMGAKQEKRWYRRCKCCGRFIHKKFYDAGIFFCDESCMGRYKERILKAG